jgi:hypothetical protein
MMNTKVDWGKVEKVALAFTAIAGAVAGVAAMYKAIVEAKKAKDKPNDDTDE